MNAFKKLIAKRNELRPELMARFPFPPGHQKSSDTGEYVRSHWQEITRFCANHMDGDCRGGETGHSENAVFRMVDRVNSLADIVRSNRPDAEDWEKRLERQITQMEGNQ